MQTTNDAKRGDLPYINCVYLRPFIESEASLRAAKVLTKEKQKF
jgi:hypothetical protein